MTAERPAPSSVRVAEVVGALSLATDLGTGMPQERGLRVAALAVRLGQVIGLDEPTLVQTYYFSQLAMLGCTADGPRSAEAFGDEIAAGAPMAPHIFGSQHEMGGWIIRHYAADQPPFQRARSVLRLMAYGVTGQMHEGSFAHCEVAQRLAARLGLDQGVMDALACTFEHWDGTGAQGLRGDAIPLAVRLGHVAWDIEVGERLGGADGCLELPRRHAGAGLDPELVERFCRAAPDVVQVLSTSSAWEAALAAEPGPPRQLQEADVETAASIFADFADLKSAYTSEHSRRVASLAATAAQQRGMDPPTVGLVHLAGLVHDVGRVAVSSGVWDRPATLRESELEQVRLHAYHTERVLRRAGCFGAAGALAGLHHERLDGSGYHRGAHAGTLSHAARLLCAADAFAAMTEPRAFRSALSPDRAAETLQAEAAAGKFDPDSVRAVLEAGGQRARPVRRQWPGGLSDREVQVLGLLARGLSMKEIAQRLVVSSKTVDHHIQHIYTKLDIRTRPAARLFAIEHGLAYDGPLA